MARRAWVYVGGRAGNKPPAAEKAAITAACERLIAEVLRPRFLSEVRPSAMFNYPVAIAGKWHGNKYRFFTRYRSDDPASLEAEFDALFARLDYVSRDCLDASSHYTPGFFERAEEARSGLRYLNSNTFCPSAVDVNGLELTALYTLQDGLPRDAE